MAEGDAPRDVDLVPLAAAGDREAFEHLYRTYHPLAVRVARRYLNPDDAADCANDVFLWLSQGRWRLNPHFETDHGRLHGFVKRLTGYVAFKTAAYRDRAARDVALFDVPGMVDLHPPSWTPEQILLRKERLLLFAVAIRALPSYLRAPARLRYLDHLSGPDIARQLDIRASTVPGYLALIREHLRRELATVYHIKPADVGHTRGGHVSFGRGHTGHRHSEQTRQRISDARRKRAVA